MCGVSLALIGCQVRGVIGSNATGISSGTGSTGSSSSSGGEVSTTGIASDDGATSTDSSDSGTEGFIFDVQPNGDAPAVCSPPITPPCDQTTEDPWLAIGIGCPHDADFHEAFTGDPRSLYVQRGALGSAGVFTPREGERMVILSTGIADQIPLTPAELLAADPNCPAAEACPNTVLSTDVLPVLPEPLDVRRVHDERDCVEDPTLVGEGDCSNTLWEEWSAGSGARDYAELRIRVVVPDHTNGFKYDFAFLSSEYPLWFNHESTWNDMYVAWLESEAWTGNVSFDGAGSPISINSVLLDYLDAPSIDCPDPCQAPELADFAMEGHAATDWLTTTAPVQAGESIVLVFALFDLTDGQYDSVILLDNFEWTCDGAPPVTKPAG